MESAVELVVDLAAVELELVEIFHVKFVAEMRRQVGKLATPGPLENVAVVHLQHVGQIAAGRLRRELRPIVGPGISFRIDRNRRILRLVEIDGGERAFVAVGISPPDVTKPRVCAAECRQPAKHAYGRTRAEIAVEIAPGDPVLHSDPP